MWSFWQCDDVVTFCKGRTQEYLGNHAEVDTGAVDTTGAVVPVVETDVEVLGVAPIHYPGQWPIPYH